ncbi:helix-turn-helix transcriptional regulator [Agrobacterium tumefaciens]|uniref:Helix-turn-helix transcriptional regulator n=1 Tax=Agrobacterium tumefaciens TaxID=358 RepID=A0AA44FCK1_AGRTU|nr:helix-turn-helix transcriptional regulator [Agrobacterium tumefaciens]NTC32061.1 helix-turn-helix transcriptional regulator [Agrobacterium tumefaciens]
MEDGPHPVDHHVGHRVRLRRTQLGISQGALGEKLGITFQQVQKYERGVNRVSASMLYEIAKALETSITFFFDGLPDGPTTSSPTNDSEQQQRFLASSEGHKLIAAISALPKNVRAKIISLAVSLKTNAEQANEDEE